MEGRRGKTNVQDVIKEIAERKNETGMSSQQIADAVGCRFGDEHAECREQIELMKAHHAEMVAHYNRALAVKTRWLRFTVVLCLVLIALIIAVLMLDVSRPGIGWFRS